MKAVGSRLHKRKELTTMDYTNSTYKNTSTSVSQRNNSDEICLSCYGDPQLNGCELVKKIEKHRLKFLDGDRSCAKHKLDQTQKYNEILNNGEIFTTLQHYRDLDDSVKFSNISEQATCSHDNHSNNEIREQLRKIFIDLDASINEKKYSINCKNDYERIEYLRAQGYLVQEGDYQTDTLYIITMPSGRAATIEEESDCINALTTRSVITNMDNRFFVVLREIEVKK